MLVSKLCNNASRTSAPGPAFVSEAPMRSYSAAVLPSLLPVLQLVSNGQRRRPNNYDSSPNSQIQIYYETGCSVVIRAAKLKFVAENKTRVYFAQKCLNLQHSVLLRDKLVTKVVIRTEAYRCHPTSDFKNPTSDIRLVKSRHPTC